MGIKTLAMGVVACLGLVTQVQAATDIGSGVLQFTGSIVESSCRGVAGTQGVRVEDCPSTGLASHVDVQRVDSQGSPVQTVSDGKHNYRLVDGNGKALSQGDYVVILTSP